MWTIPAKMKMLRLTHNVPDGLAKNKLPHRVPLSPKSLGVPTVTIYPWVRRGILPHIRLGKCIRFDPAEINTWITGKKKPAS